MRVGLAHSGAILPAIFAAWMCTQSPPKAGPATTVAATPPMGWNSWDSFGTSVTEAEVKANADYMAKNLKQHGWEYIVVDIQWSEQNPRSHGYRPDADLAMDEYGRLIPAPNRFPSSAGGHGFKPLADYIHGLGLKFGIHIMRGIPRRAVRANLPVFGSKARASDIADQFSVCPWNSDMYGVDMSRRDAQDYYDSILELYARWGVDYLKADDIARPAHREEIAALHSAILKTRRPIALSLSPGPAMVKDAEFYRQNANMWRISDDFWDEWRLLRLNFTLMSIWSAYGRPGAWPDADMLPLGHIGIRAERGEDRRTRFTPDEQRTMMSLWSIAQSPLMFGGHLPDNDESTTSLITNDEVLEVNRRGTVGRAFAESGDSVVWVADAVGAPAKYLAVFNVGDRAPIDVRVEWRALGLPARCVLRDLWERNDVGVIDGGYTFRVAPHASGLYRLTDRAHVPNAAWPVLPGRLALTFPPWWR
jgi:alpha-galactosidase